MGPTSPVRQIVPLRPLFAHSRGPQLSRSDQIFGAQAAFQPPRRNLSSLIDSLKSGSPVLIVDRGRPVARLEPATVGGEDDGDGRLSRLVRDGLVRPARAAPSRSLFSRQPPRADAGASALDALIEDRRDGR